MHTATFPIRRILLIIAAVHLCTSLALADAILTSDNRSLTTSGAWRMATTPVSMGSWDFAKAPQPFADFSDKVVALSNSNGMAHPTLLDVWAQQTSTVTATDLNVTGTAHLKASMNASGCSAGGCVMGGSAASRFEIGFTLLSDHAYSFDAFRVVGEMYLAQVGVGHILEMPEIGTGSGLLHAGSYLLYAGDSGAFSLMNGEMYQHCCSSYQLAFHLQQAAVNTPVAEPSTLALLAVALLFVMVICLQKITDSPEWRARQRQ